MSQQSPPALLKTAVMSNIFIQSYLPTFLDLAIYSFEVGDVKLSASTSVWQSTENSENKPYFCNLFKFCFKPVPHIAISWASIMCNLIVLSTTARFKKTTKKRNMVTSLLKIAWRGVVQLFLPYFFFFFLLIHKAYLFRYLVASLLKKFQPQIAKHWITLLVGSNIKFNEWNHHTMVIFWRIFGNVNQEVANIITSVGIDKMLNKIIWE